ncbi:MAG: aminotransferase class V-fold PLP-dependent enzyme [Pirellulales bacterium]
MRIIDTNHERLAIHGGPRALDGELPSWPPSDEAVRKALADAWAVGSWGRYHGPHVERLAAELAEMHGVEYVLPVCSGTFAVELALRGLKIGAGDEVLLAGYDFPGNFRAIEATQARPVLVDVEPAGCLIDLERLATAIGPHTRAVIVSHLHGMLVDMPRVMEQARELELTVVEDACQTPGAVIAGRAAGAWGDVGVLSFGGSKLLTAGRGGALLTADDEIHQRCKIYCHRGNHAFPMSELQAAVLVPQLSKLAERNRRRAASVEQLRAETVDVPTLRPLVNRTSAATPTYYKVAWQYLPAAAGDAPIDEFVAALAAEGAPLDRGFRGFASRGQRRCRKSGTLDHSRRAAESTILLHHPILLEPPEQISLLARAMAKVAAAFAQHGRSRGGE